MILIGLIISIVGLILLILSWRGRVVASGQYCRACRFDLAGLDIEISEAKCPECGNEVHQESARRTTSRQRSQLGVVLTSVMVMIGVLTLAFGASGKTGIILGHLPDTTIFWLNDLGLDEALDELVVRVSRTTNPIADELLARAIEDALAHQADLTQVWDPRWGEVLAVSFGNPVMTDDQMLQYLRNGLEITAEIRDRVYQGDQGVNLKIKTVSSRMSAMNLHDTGYWLFNKPVEGGVIGQPAHHYMKNAGLGTNFVLHRRGGPNLPWSGTLPVGSGFDVDPGTLVPLYFEYELKFSEIGVIGHYRSEQMVMVLAPEDPVVPSFIDAQMAKQFCESISISTVRVLDPIPDADPMSGHFVLAIRTQFSPLPASTAFDVFLRFNNGDLVSIGSWVNQAPHAKRLGGVIAWPKKVFSAEIRAQAAPVIERLIAQGQVDVVMRSNPSLADSIPGIDRVLDVSLEFVDISVEILDKPFALQKSAKKPEELFPASCP